MWLLAQSAPQTFLDWAQFGALGLIIVGFIFGMIWPRPPVERLQKDFDRALNKLEENDKFNREVVIPAITQSNDLYRETVDVIREALIVIKQLRDQR